MTLGADAVRLRGHRRRAALTLGCAIVLATVPPATLIRPPEVHVPHGADALAVTPDGRNLFVITRGDTVTMAGFGMARYHIRHMEPGWRRRLVINFASGVYSALLW